MEQTIIPGVIDGEQVLCCLPGTATAEEAARMMRERQVGAILIVSEGRLEGIVTERDLVFRLLADQRDPTATPISAIMTYDPETLRPGDSALAALDMMRLGRYRHLPVMDGETIIGIVSVGDLYQAVRQTLEEQLQSAETLIYGEQYTLAAI